MNLPGISYQTLLSPEQEQTCNYETPGLLGSSAGADGTSWNGPTPHRSQSETRLASVRGGSNRERSPLRC